MGFLIKNANRSVSLSLTALKLVGFWAPQDLSQNEKILYSCYAVFSFMFLLGTYLIIQVIDLFLIWGDLPLMTGTAFLLFTNLAQAAKIFNIVLRRQLVQSIVDEADDCLMGVESDEARKVVRSCDKETSRQQLLFFVLTVITTLGWAASAEKNQLPLRAWYPYDTTRRPAYQLTYVHQVLALFVAAYLNVAKDSLVSSLVAQCRCRLRLTGLALQTLGQDMVVPPYGLLVSISSSLKRRVLPQQQFSPSQERVVSSRLRSCVVQHQAALAAAHQLQECFSVPTFAQFTVSLIIICVTAFQLVSQTDNVVRLMSMGTYLLNMCFQVFIYCYQGNQLSEESSEIAEAAYSCPWYLWSSRLRRSLLVVMVRSRRVARLTAGGFTTLSLASFMALPCVSNVAATSLGCTIHSLAASAEDADITYAYVCASLMLLYICAYVIVQAADFFHIRGNIPLMVGSSFLLFTNLAFGTKIINVMMRGKSVQAMIDEGEAELAAENRVEGMRIVEGCNRETTRHLYLYALLSGLTVLGWAASADKSSSLPLRAWYPYDTSKSPVYEITYFHQASALCFCATLHVSLDTLATSLIAICRCRLRLVNLSLTELCSGICGEETHELEIQDDNIILLRLKNCIRKHIAILNNANEIQRRFFQPILAQFAASTAIMCATTYELSVELHKSPKNSVRIMGMSAYLLCMVLQVFLYCYQGNQLLIESTEISSAAYSCPWYLCSLRVRRSLLVVMARSARETRLTAAGITTLSLATFTSIMKASYTFFTVLQQVEDGRK